MFVPVRVFRRPTKAVPIHLKPGKLPYVFRLLGKTWLKEPDWVLFPLAFSVILLTQYSAGAFTALSTADRFGTYPRNLNMDNCSHWKNI